MLLILEPLTGFYKNYSWSLLLKLCWNLLNMLKETGLIKLNGLALDSTSI